MVLLQNRHDEILKMFSDLSFDSQRHLYWWKGKRVPFSVSGLVNQHAPKFDSNKIVYSGKSILQLSAAKASREEGKEVTTHELERKWQLINDDACSLGTKVHKFMEDYSGIQTPTLPQEVAGIKYIKDLVGEYRISFKELRAYSEEFDYAGTMDLPLEVIGTDEFTIDDYKTNGDLFKSYDNLYPPFDYLKASAFNKIQIQLSYYQIMLEEKGLKIKNRRLVHLKADETYRIYDLLDLTDELRDYRRKVKTISNGIY